MVSKTVEQRFRKLSEIEHVLKRSGRYLGAIAVTPHQTYIINDGKVEWKELNFSPAFLKIFDEIISNSADFSKTAEGKHVNKIDVVIDKSNKSISVFDNGGIPVVKHKDYDQYVPEMIFGEMRSGSNFDDDADSTTTGQNGEGCTLTNIFSKEFIVDTSDGKNRCVITYSDNMGKKVDPKITKSTKKYTKITYIPDYERIGATLDADHIAILERRVYEIAATNPHLNVTLNGKPINFKAFKDFTALFSDNTIDFGTDKFQASLFHSKNGFQQIGFVNSTNVFQGGTIVDLVMNQITSGIRDYIKKKTKQDIKPSDIKNHFFLMTNSTINNPRYNSQTKELLQTQPKDFGTTIEVDAKTLQRIIKSDIVEEIITWAENKAALEELAALKKKNKELSKSGNSLRDITKYEPATSKDRGKCILFIAEGDSAAKALQSARNPEIHGVYPLRGKPDNVKGLKIKELIEIQELANLMMIIGLEFGKKHSLYELRYRELVVSTDQDLDGFHLCALIINIFHELWPDLIKQGFLFKLQTPIVRVVQNKKEIEFMYSKDFHEWEKKQTKPFQATYLKGLGSNDTKYFKEYMFKPEYKVKLIFTDESDSHALDIAFNDKKADERKTYLYGERS